jgi:hypothetical protein
MMCWNFRIKGFSGHKCMVLAKFMLGGGYGGGYFLRNIADKTLTYFEYP